MNRRRGIALGLILGLGIGLHLTFRGLSGELPTLFPVVARETSEEVVLTTAFLEEMESAEVSTSLLPHPSPSPSGSVPVKRSGETVGSLEPPPETPQEAEGPFSHRRIVRSTPVPPLSLPSDLISSASFETPPGLQQMVDFWKKIYAVYDTHHVVLHDMDHLRIQYGVMDFSALDDEAIPDAEKKKIREAQINREMERIRRLLAECDAASSSSTPLHTPLHTPLPKEARRIASLFHEIDDPEKFSKAREALRAQVGLKNRFREALQRSGRYLPLFEEIFGSYGVPREITRLAFVESLFKERALSKVGAAGLWQFMPGTATRYMIVDPLIDERYDPVIATHGAAKLLLRNHELLGTWPLAINAYNSGPGNLLKAVSKLGTRDIAAIITRYRSPGYAFASRNFYTQFLAALEVYENEEKFFGHVEKDPPLRFELVELPTTMTFPEIAYLADHSLREIEELNPSFRSSVFRGDYSLPAGTQIRVPLGGEEMFASRFAGSYQAAETPIYHVVLPGETLQEIASRYALSPADLRRANGSEKLEVGKVLNIPTPTSLVQEQF